MNAARTKRLKELQSRLEPLAEMASDLADEEREAFYNMPESLQKTEKGQALDQSSDSLDEMADALRTWADWEPEAA